MRVEEIDALLGGEAQRLADKFRNVPLDFMDGYGWAVTQICRLYPDAVPVEWIPCSERLPKKTDLYFVTILDERDDSEYTSCMTYCINLARWEVEVNVIAWMPLPEPYEERKEE